MGKTAAASSRATASRDMGNPKHKSKKSKSASHKKAKKQEADLVGIGAQFWQDNETQHSSSSGDYPKKITL